jgi:hypothetical protein
MSAYNPSKNVTHLFTFTLPHSSFLKGAFKPILKLGTIHAIFSNHSRRMQLKSSKIDTFAYQVFKIASIVTFMDFFSTAKKTASSASPITDEAEACACVLIACLRANELDGDSENAAFYTAIHSRNVFKGHDASGLVATAGHYFEQYGSSAALIDAAIGAIRDQTRIPLFFHCLDVMLSDGLVTPTEHKIFLYLKKKFKVDDDLAAQGLEVLLEKNKL